jgi:di/tripeptidase
MLKRTYFLLNFYVYVCCATVYTPDVNIETLKDLLAVPTLSYKEHALVNWLVHYITHNIPGCTVTIDPYRNVYVRKGTAKQAPCIGAHIDSVQPLRKVKIVQEGTRIIGYADKNRQVGIGGDDKAGVFVCLNLLERFSDISVIFFATEECGCVGARNVDPEFIAGVGYLIEYDCPSRNMLSYSVGGTRLFQNRGDFIQTAFPVLMRHGTQLWQRHPYTDVMAIRRLFPISCLNLSCGYYNWHADNEFVSLPDVDLAIAQGEELIATLGSKAYPCPIDLAFDTDAPLTPITSLHVPDPLS